MPAQFRIDQVGRPTGTNGVTRTDGLATGALVTLTSTGGGTTHKFELLWVPEEDETAVSSLVQTGTPNIWTFSPDADVYGTYRIQLTIDEGLSTEDRAVRLFAIRTPKGLRIPAPNERANPTASLANSTPLVIAASEDNEPVPDGPFAAGNWAGWYRSQKELYQAVETGGGIGVIFKQNETDVSQFGSTFFASTPLESGQPTPTVAITFRGPTQNGGVGARARIDYSVVDNSYQKAHLIKINDPNTGDHLEVGDRFMLRCRIAHLAGISLGFLVHENLTSEAGQLLGWGVAQLPSSAATQAVRWGRDTPGGNPPGLIDIPGNTRGGANLGATGTNPSVGGVLEFEFYNAPSSAGSRPYPYVRVAGLSGMNASNVGSSMWPSSGSSSLLGDPPASIWSGRTGFNYLSLLIVSDGPPGTGGTAELADLVIFKHPMDQS